MRMDIKLRKKAKFVTKIFVSLVLLSWLYFKIDWQNFFLLANSISFKYVIIFVLLYLVSVGISACKWQKIANLASLKMSLRSSYSSYITGAFINTFLPSTIGGDTYRVISLSGGSENKKTATATVVADRISGLIMTMILAVIFGFSNSQARSNEWFFGTLCFISISLVAFFAFLFFAKTKIAKKMYSSYPNFLKSLISSLQPFREPKAFVLMGFWSALFAFVGPAALNYIMFLAFGIHLAFLDYLSVVFAASVFISFPISVGNIGVKEWAYVTLFGIFGVSISQAVAVAFFGRLLMTGVNAIALPMYLKEKR